MIIFPNSKSNEATYVLCILPHNNTIKLCGMSSCCHTIILLAYLAICLALKSDQNPEILLCRKCGGDVADSSYLIDRLSSSAQGFRKENLFGRGVFIQKLVNPYGVKFEVITAEKARCDNIGTPQGADSWFPGHTWRICACPHCRQFLGWTFEKTDGSDKDSLATFHGLILSNILGENFTDSLIMMPKTQSM